MYLYEAHETPTYTKLPRVDAWLSQTAASLYGVIRSYYHYPLHSTPLTFS